MARAGTYPVQPKEDLAKNGWEIRRCKSKRICWGAEVLLEHGRYLNTKSPLCDGTVNPREIYLVRPDRRDNRVEWSVCMKCAAHYHENDLIGDIWVYKIQAPTPEEFKNFGAKTVEIYEALNNLGG